MSKLSEEIYQSLLRVKEKDFDACVRICHNAERTKTYKTAKRTSSKSTYEDCVIHALKAEYKFNTCKGKRTAVLEEDHRDPYEVRTQQVPVGIFYYCTSNKCYMPTWVDIECNDFMFSIKYQAYRQEVIRAWNKVKRNLCQERVGGGLIEPIMTIKTGDHVYFMEDKKNKQIKIGVSSCPSRRRYTVERDYCRTNINVIHLIEGGGYGLEKFLHKRFSGHRVWRRKEWFSDSREIRDYIKKVKAGTDPWEC